MIKIEALRVRARAIAESQFYSDDECRVPWEPFEFWPQDDIQDQMHDLEKTILNAMLWAQGKGTK